MTERSANVVVLACPVCGSRDHRTRFDVPNAGTEGGVSAEAFRPSSERYGGAVGRIVQCRACSHGFVAELPATDAIANAYAEAADPVSLREEAGQVETGRRALADIERFLAPGRVLDIGCWTGSFLLAARERGWTPVGLEPSGWAAARARERGLEVHEVDLKNHGLEPGSFRLVVMCDVIEHLESSYDAVTIAGELLEEGGGLFLTLPDAGSLMARVLGKRWWSVLPMHLQYFTRRSLQLLLQRCGFEVRSMSTHPKVFTARYYAERLGGYSGRLQGVAVRSAQLLGFADRLVAPDFRDRMAVVATRSRS